MLGNDTQSPDNALLSTVSFPYRSFMAKYIHEYATVKEFLPLQHKCMNHFNGEAITKVFPEDKSYHLLESNPNQDKK